MKNSSYYFTKLKASSITIILIILMAVVTIASYFVDMTSLTMVGALVEQGQWWRLLTGFLNQGTIVGLALNALMLFWIGYRTENIFGRWRYLLIVIASAVVSNLIVFLGYRFWGGYGVSGGAGGVIFGIGGSAVALFMLYRDRYMYLLPPILTSVGVIAAWTIIFSYGNLLSQLGGFLGGFLIAGLICNISPPK
ncbi:rhomboid family intramembrane serine protease [Culicoidibacter larvae]|uniref:Rhomboid family intramembrane serine protease n=1 Tax=Culicoidibacter larvae TaxID=2579976 RepID=A0A5R8QF02_9FIRM|nr:rhomboid family intramembrane serine protease [Culicoidibacter larvae]TLG76609.1 rhomboid family intramembrane serine protease [Culicoidibacter larvae]